MKKTILATAVTIALGTSTYTTAGNTLIITENYNDGNIYESMANNISDNYQGNVDIFQSHFTGDYSQYDQIWDVRLNDSLSSNESSDYLNFLSDGGTLFLMGEHNYTRIGDFSARNNSIFQLIESLGAGSLNLVPYDMENDTQTIIGSGNTHIFGTAGSVASSGTGSFVTSNSNGSGSILAWQEGELANATEGALAIGFDINFLESIQSPVNQELINLLVTLLEQGVLIVDPVIEDTQESIALDTLDNQVNIIAGALSGRVKAVLRTATGVKVADVYGAPTGLSAGDQMNSGMSIWVAPSWTSFDNDVGTRYEGDTNSLIIGIDKLLNSGRTVVGATIMAEDTDIDYKNLTGSQSGTGISGSLYAGHVFSNNFILDGFIGFGGVSIDDNRNGVTSDYDTDRFIAGLNLTKHFEVNDSNIVSVGAGLTHSSEDLDAYTQSNGNVVNPDDVKLTQATFNIQLTHLHGNMSPFVLAGFDTDIEREGGNDQSDEKQTGLYAGVGFDYAKGNMTYGAEATYRHRNNDDSFTVGANFRYSF